MAENADLVISRVLLIVLYIGRCIANSIDTSIERFGDDGAVRLCVSD
jgi:hypothetical protein